MIAPSSNVQSLMEMGFPRQAVEQAVKALAGIGNLNPSPESIVGWILEHPGYKDDDKEILDEATEESSEDNDDEDSDEEDESGTEISDSFEDIDASGASEAVMTGIPTGVPMPMIEIFKRRVDFVNRDDYALYVRGHVQAGMTVRCCRTYEEVHEGDVGKVVKLDRDELHDLNVQVRHNFEYFLRYQFRRQIVSEN